MQSLQLSLFLAVIAVAFPLIFIKPASSQEHSRINSPPILVVPDRNWRILETEPVGQIISRIRADDFENDELFFGLELANKGTINPFRIDPVGGTVYLKDNLTGRGGENFFLYITVTDGQLTAKNEVYVNILPVKNYASGRPQPSTPSLSNIIHNISHFLPSFDRLPGVQSIRNTQPNGVPSNILPPGFNNAYPPSMLNSNSNKTTPMWPKNSDDSNNSEQNTEDFIDMPTTVQTASASARPTNQGTVLHQSKNYKKFTSNLSAINNGGEENNIFETVSEDTLSHEKDTILKAFNSKIIPFLLSASGVLLAVAIIVGFICRKRFCIFNKTIIKGSKEEMAKKSNQSNSSNSNLTDNSHNSMVMQHWNGPLAYGNRYVPWEREQQTQWLTQQQIPQEPINNSHLTASGSTMTNSALMGNAVDESSSAMGGAGSGSRPSIGSVQLTEDQKYDAWEFPRHRLKFFNILGEGAFGQVWRCEATDINGAEGVKMVAVKTLKENATESEKKDLLSELKVMKSLEPHVNVVRFLGCCTDKDPIFVIIEYVKYGKLQTYLRNSRAERHYGNTHGSSNILTSGDLISFMCQVGKGMDYLATRGIIHRDLAARNILISEDRTCKVADFGFARDVITTKIYERKSEGKLPIRWMAIESLYDNVFSVKSDIWSFGILMWEIVTLGSTPYPGISASEVMRKVRDGYRLEKPEHCKRELYNIMYYCWYQNPKGRPTFGELVQMLDKLLHTEMDYIELERFPDHNYYNIISLSGEKV